MGIVQLLPIMVLLLPAIALGKGAATFKRSVAGAEVDFAAGTITAEAGSAADMRMPGPNAARPGAERRARAAAEEKLRAALAILAHGNPIDGKAALAHATVTRTEYQSDGGVVLWLTLRFSDVLPAKAATVVLKLPAMPFEFAPVITGSGRDVQTAFATYRSAADCPKDAVRAALDGKGRLTVASSGKVDALDGAAVVICIEKELP